MTKEKGPATLLRTAVGLSVISAVGKILGFAREQVIAWRFGATAGVDSYIAALAVPQLLAGILGGAVAAAFLPVYTSLRAKDPERAKQMAATCLKVTLALAAGVALLFYVAAPAIMGVLVGDFASEQQALTVSLLRIMVIGTVLLSVSFFLTMLLNAHKVFAVPALTPVVGNVVIVVGVLTAGALGIRGLAYFTTLSMALPIVVLAGVVLYMGLPLAGKVNFRDPDFAQVIRLSLPVVYYSMFTQVYVLVDRRLASGLDAGSISALNYSFKLVQLPVGVFAVALVTAIYPTLADFAARGDQLGFGRAVSQGMRFLAMLLVPAGAGMIALRFPLIRLAFERGSFDAVATSQTAWSLGFYAVGLMGVAGAPFLARAFYALQDTKTPVKVGIATAVTNTVLAITLVRPLGHGGLALANSLGMLLNAGVLLFFLSKRVTPGALSFAPLMGKVLVASVVMGAVATYVHRAAVGFGQILSLGIAVTAGLGVYGVLLIVLRVEEVSQVRDRLMRYVR